MIELAVRNLGGEVIWVCENEQFCQRVLRKRLPDVPIIEDVRGITAGIIRYGFPDVLVGGFPCQGISGAGRGKGLDDPRSGLWFEFLRIIKMIKPRLVLIENVRNLLSKGMPVVLQGLRDIGYDAEWDVIPAAAVGAAHLRERVWIQARPREDVEAPIYGDELRDKHGEPVSFSFEGKIPRAGRMNSHLRGLTPVALRKTKRKDGWSYWVGVNLWGERGAQVLWPYFSFRDHKDTGDLNCVDDNGLLPRWVFHVEQGTALLPTPDAYGNGNGNGPANHMAKKAEKCGGPRQTITNLDVIARNGFAQANGRLWPTTTTTDAKAARNETSGRSNPDSRHHSGTTLLDAMIKDGEPVGIQASSIASNSGSQILSASAERTRPRAPGAISIGGSREEGIWPTPSARLGDSRGPQIKRFFNPDRSVDLDDAVAARGDRGSLNPDWVEWLMGTPLGWTDLSLPNWLLTQTPWWYEPVGVPRVATGIKDRSARLRALGNAVVWPCAFVALERGLRAVRLIG